MAQDKRPHFIMAATASIIVLGVTLGLGVWILLKGNPLDKTPITIETQPTAEPAS